MRVSRSSSGILVGSVLLSAVLASCSTPPITPVVNDSSTPAASASSSSSGAPATPSATPTPTVPPVKLTSNIDDGATKVKVDTLVSAAAKAGTLSKVKLAYSYTDRKGAVQKGKIKGDLNKKKTTWKATERLEPSADYKLTMVGANAARESITDTASFTTQALALNQQTFPSLYPLADSKVGVGMPLVLNFDVAVTDKKEVEKNLHVTSSPSQAGSWHWYNDREVRFRPKKYWKAGTKVSVDANLNGVSAGNGIYGQSSAQTNFTVGRSLVTKINLAKDVATVYQNGKKIRTIYVSGGKAGWQTRSGIKLIMGRETNKKMTNEMIGAKEDYDLTVKYAMRITNSGEFLHSAPWNTANFGRRNASHGCVGMSESDAAWLYSRVRVGDPVETTGSSRKMELGNGYGDWNASWSSYQKGSAA